MFYKMTAEEFKKITEDFRVNVLLNKKDSEIPNGTLYKFIYDAVNKGSTDLLIKVGENHDEIICIDPQDGEYMMVNVNDYYKYFTKLGRVMYNETTPTPSPNTPPTK